MNKREKILLTVLKNRKKEFETGFFGLEVKKSQIGSNVIYKPTKI
jgi:hypothetical protein